MFDLSGGDMWNAVLVIGMIIIMFAFGAGTVLAAGKPARGHDWKIVQCSGVQWESERLTAEYAGG